MQFKVQKNKIQVLVYTGYDKAKKRAIVKMVGSLDRFTYEPTSDFLNELTILQREEVQSYINESRQSSDLSVLQYRLEFLDSHIKVVSEGLADGRLTLESDNADKLWEAIGLLSATLRKTGHAKPKRVRKTSNQPDQTDLFSSDKGDSFPVGAAAAAAVALDFRQNLSDE